MVLWTSVSCLALVPRMYLSLCCETHLTLSTSVSSPGSNRISLFSIRETNVACLTSVSCPEKCRICRNSCCETDVAGPTSVSCPEKCRICWNPCRETHMAGPTSVSRELHAGNFKQETSNRKQQTINGEHAAGTKTLQTSSRHETSRAQPHSPCQNLRSRISGPTRNFVARMKRSHWARK